MTDESKSLSPLTGQPAIEIPWRLQRITSFEEAIGTWAVTEEVARRGFCKGGIYQSNRLTLTEKQTAMLLSLAQSIVWDSKYREKKTPIFVTQHGFKSTNQRDLDVFAQDWRIIPIEELWAQYESISFEEKSLRTLSNFAMIEDEMGDGVHLPLSLHPFPGGFAAHRFEELTSPEGLLYASAGKEGLYVLRHLIKKGWVVEAEDQAAQLTSLYLTAEGYAVADQITKGQRSEVRRAFMVCRFIEVLDDIFERCYKPAGEHEDVLCPIVRVKDVHHVDRIDDKIVRLIEESSIVVVDLTEQNFNVAFEAGYALALKKPIVWTQREEDGDFRPPFDIQSQNILRWHPDKLEEFSEALRFRMLAALDKAKSTGRSSV